MKKFADWFCYCISFLMLTTIIPLCPVYGENPFRKIILPEMKKCKGLFRLVCGLSASLFGVYIYVLTPSSFKAEDYPVSMLAMMLLIFPPFLQLLKLTFTGQFQYFDMTKQKQSFLILFAELVFFYLFFVVLKLLFP